MSDIEKFLKDEDKYKKLIPFLKERYKNYEILDYPEVEIDVRAVQIGENSDGSPIAGQEQYQRHIHDNLGFKNKETGIEEITLCNMGFTAFQGFKDLREVVEFLDEKLTKQGVK